MSLAKAASLLGVAVVKKTDHATTIDALTVWKDQLHLFGKGCEPGAGVPGSGDQNLGVPLSSMCILIINMGSGNSCVVVLKLNIMPEFGFLPPELCWKRLALYSNDGKTSPAGGTECAKCVLAVEVCNECCLAVAMSACQEIWAKKLHLRYRTDQD